MVLRKRAQPCARAEREALIGRDHPPSMRHPAKLLDIGRGGVQQRRRPTRQKDRALRRRMDRT
jgi:hypothetical protein